MRIDSKSPVRLIMPNGTFTIQDVNRIVVGKIQDPMRDFPKELYFRSVRIETDDGSIEILMESALEKNLRMESEGGSIFKALKKQVAG